MNRSITGASSTRTRRACPRLAALGNQGKVDAFNRDGSYEDPNGGSPTGSLVTKALDLRLVKDPVLSFGSWYDTEDRSNNVDRKSVWIRSLTSAGTWGPETRLPSIEGDAGGYKKWRTQTTSLAPFRDNVIQVRFEFVATTNATTATDGSSTTSESTTTTTMMT